MKIRKILTTAFAVFAMLAFAGVASADHHETGEANPCGGEVANPCGGDGDEAANPCNPCGGDGDEAANPCGGDGDE